MCSKAFIYSSPISLFETTSSWKNMNTKKIETGFSWYYDTIFTVDGKA